MRCASRWPRWRRRAATSALDQPRRGLPQFRHQALERRALLRDEGCRARRRISTRRRPQLTVNRWILAEPARTAARSPRRSRPIASTKPPALLYHFVWNVVLRLVRRTDQAGLTGDDEAARPRRGRPPPAVLDQILKLLHPFMPFMTEELWDQTAALGPERQTQLIEAGWPTPAAMAGAMPPPRLKLPG